MKLLSSISSGLGRAARWYLGRLCFVVFFLCCLAVGGLAGIGYLANIVFLIKAATLATMGQVAVSIIGIFMAPLGALHGLGWMIGWW